MKPVDFRNATFDMLAGYIVGQRERVFNAWGSHGPCTTKQLAEQSGISILTVRPRTNELVTLGFIRLADRQPVKGEGTYRVSTPDELADFIAASRNPQRELSLGA